MNVIYRGQAKQEGQEHALLQQATKVLEDIVGSSHEEVSAIWEQSRDARGRILYTVNLSDSTGQVSTTFDLRELRSLKPLRGRFLSLWGDLLQVRSDAQLKKLQQLIGQEDSKVRQGAARRYSFKQLMARVTAENIHDEIQTHTAVGKEAL